MADQLKFSCRRFEDEMFVESEDGYMLANLYRSASRSTTGQVVRLVKEDCSEYEAGPNVTTEGQWQGIVNLFSAAPEMLATLQDLRREIRAGSILDAGNIEEWGRCIDEVLAKAEPPRKVKVRLTFEVEVEKQEHDYLTIARARNEVLVCGNGRNLNEEIVEGGVAVRCDGKFYEDASHEMLSRGDC